MFLHVLSLHRFAAFKKKITKEKIMLLINYIRCAYSYIIRTTPIEVLFYRIYPTHGPTAAPYIDVRVLIHRLRFPI